MNALTYILRSILNYQYYKKKLFPQTKNIALFKSNGAKIDFRNFADYKENKGKMT